MARKIVKINNQMTKEKKYFSAMAIVSFVLGIVSILGGAYLLAAFFYTAVITPIAAIVFGIIGLRNIKRSNVLRGKVFAWFGIVLAFAWIIFFVVSYFFIPIA